MDILFVVVLIVSIIIFLLKLFNYIYYKPSRDRSTKNPKKSVIIIQSTPSYGNYVKVSQRTSSPNKPNRKSGDFLDCILKITEATKNGSVVENNIMNLYGVDLNE